MASSQSTPEWNAKVSTTLERASADQIWPLLSDFFNLHRWFPSLATCHGVHGTSGEPGSVRYCTGFSVSAVGHSDGTTEESGVQPVKWSKERLVSVDPVRRSLCYEMVESNIGFESYVSTIGVVPSGDGCVIEWEFVVDPVEGWELDGLVRKYEAGLRSMAKKMEDHVSGTH